MKNTLCVSLAAWLLLISLPAAWAQRAATDSTRWEKNIATFEMQDKESPPPKGALLFVGSSTIVRWKSLPQDFPEHKTINRGFGGNQIADSTYYADRMIIPYAPKAIYLRAGGNDLNAGKTVDRVFADYKEFVAKVHGKLPQTDIYFISLSPSIARWKQADKEKAVNELIMEYVQGKPHLHYIETYDMVLGADGQPRAELFVDDKLHFSEAGYKLLIGRVRPYVQK